MRSEIDSLQFNEEETDTRFVIYIKYAEDQGFESVVVHTPDTFSSSFFSYPWPRNNYICGYWNRKKVETRYKNYNQFHNVLRLFDVLLNFPFSRSELMRDNYL